MNKETMNEETTPPISIGEMIKSAARELAMRRSVYARRVADGKMRQAAADHEIACTAATLALLQSLQSLPRWVSLDEQPAPAGWCGLAAPDAQPIHDEACFAYERGGRIYDSVTQTPDAGLRYWLYAPGLFLFETWPVEDAEPEGAELTAIRLAGREKVRTTLRGVEAGFQAGEGRGDV